MSAKKVFKYTKEKAKNYNHLLKTFHQRNNLSIKRSVVVVDTANRIEKLISMEQDGRNRTNVIVALQKRQRAILGVSRRYGRTSEKEIIRKANRSKVFQPVQRFANVRWSGKIEFQQHWFIEHKMHKEKQDEVI